MKSRLLSICVSFALIFSITLPASASASTLPSVSAKDILSEFHQKSFELTQSQANIPSTLTTHTLDTLESLASIRHETVNKLLDLGYSAYEVTSNTYDTVEEVLNTELSNLGLQRDSSYIVIVGDINEGAQTSRSTPGSSFSYKYGGQEYKLRTLTVTGADSSSYIQASSVDLLKRHTDSVVEALINTTIGAYATAVGVPAIFGTIGSITGLTTVHFTSKTDSTAVYHGGSSWTKLFTQAWDDNYNQWVSGSSVEYLTQISYINGLKYDAATNRYQNYESLDQTKVSHSPEYFDAKWRNDNAVVGYIGAFPNISDKTGDACYTYGSKVIIRHSDNFI